VADALLVHETLDAEQVRRLAAGLPLDDAAPAQGPPPSAPEPRDASRAKDRPAPAIVPPLPPRPVTQE
jgi:hypothetical protein